MYKEKIKRAFLLEQSGSVLTKILIMVCFAKIILSKKQPEANVEKAIIPIDKHKICFGCGDKYDWRVMSEFKWKLHSPGCTQEILWGM